MGLAPRDLAFVIGTHHHPDHFGASEDLRALGAGEFLLHAAELERIEERLFSLRAAPRGACAFRHKSLA